jgi:protoheme ferro-lyase
MKSPFEKKFCGKSPLKELTAKQEANLPEALKTAIEAKSPTNYGSPLEQSSFGKSKPSIVSERS